MASFTERIQVIIDVTTNKATQGLKDFRSAVGEAQGFTGKLKAGVSSLGQTFSGAISGPVGMAAAIGTAATAAFKAVSDYADLGIEIGNFSTATGLATEDASRWIEVAGDLGVEAGTLQSAIGKLNKTVDPKLFKDLGVEIAHTSDGAVDAGKTFENVLEKLRSISDPTERARVAAQLLGKGWQDLAPLIGQSADEIKSRLGDVADVKVFSQQKVDQSRKFQDALDDLKDAGEELALSLGETVIPALSTAAKVAAFAARQGSNAANALLPSSKMANVNQIIERLADAYKKYGDVLLQTDVARQKGLTSFRDIDNATLIADDGAKKLVATLIEQADALVVASQAANRAAIETAGLGDDAVGSQRYLGLLAQQLHDASGAADDLGGKAEYAKQSLKLLQNQISGRSSFIDLAQQLKDNAAKIKDLEKQYADNKITAEEYYLGVAKAALDSKGAVADYVSTVDAISEDQKLQITAELDPASPGNMIRTIDNALINHTFQVTAETNVETRRGTSGGMGGGGATFQVNVYPGAGDAETGRRIVQSIQAYYRAGGNRLS